MITASWISTIIIFLAMAFTSFGRRQFRMIRLIIPIVILAFVGQQYLHDIPTSGNNLLVIVGAGIVGLILGGMMLLMTKLDHDPKTNTLYTVSGIGTIAIWVFAFALRISTIEWVTHHPKEYYLYSTQHGLDVMVIAPAFICMAAMMILVRVVGILVRVPPLSE